MADLESLDIRINASAGQATGAIDTLIRKFGDLNRALQNFGADSDYVKGLDNLVGGLERLGDAVSAIDPQHVRDMSSALGKLATNGDKLAKLSGKTFLSGVADESRKMAVASEEARKKAEALAASYNFDMKGEGVDRLAMAIDKLQTSAGNDQAIRDTKQEIEGIITSYSRYENELHEVAKAENELIRNSHKKLNRDWAEQFGDTESARRARGKLGIGTSSREGGSGESFITENASLGLQAAANETDNLSLALERLEQNEADAKNEFVGFYDVSETVSGGIQQVKADIDELCASLGIATEKMAELKSASATADDDFMDLSGIDLDEEPWMQGDTASKIEQVATAEEHAASAGQQMATSLEQVGQAGNLFTPIADGLTELSAAVTNIPDMTNLLQLKDVVSKIGGVSGQNAATFLPQIAQGLQSLEGKVPALGPQLSELALGLRALGSPNITRAAETIPWISEGLRMLEGIKVTADVEAISNLAYAVSRFGLANINKSIANMPLLAESLRGLVNSLSALPPVSENTIALLNALGGLNVNASSALRSMNGLSGGLRRYTGSARRAHRQSLSLASAIGRMYANFFLLFRLIRKAGDSISLASQLREVQNVVDVTFGDMADKMNEFAAQAVDTIGMAELTAKQVGSRFQAMGSAMGISPALIRSTSEFVETATNGYAQVSDSMADMSMNLTKLAGDMASFYNLDYEDVAEKLTAVFTGQTRPLRTFGLDLTQASLKAFALANGLNADVKNMTQAEKTMLRYQYVLAHTTAARGDFQRTIMTWANQTRIAQERIKQLMNVLGQIGIYTFKPLVINFNNAMNRIIELATSTLNSLGKIFGWQIEWSDAGILRDEAEDLEDIADGYDDAGASAKKFKNFLLGIDELNLLPDDKDKGKGGADDLADLYGEFGDMSKNLNIKPIEGYFDSLYDTLYKLGKRIGEVELDWLRGIDWDKVFDKARGFGDGLADFLNGYLSNAELFYEKGRFVANGINTIANAIDGFFKRFNGWQFGVDIGTMINGFTENLDWNVIRSAATEFAHDVAQTINGAVMTTDWSMVGSTIANVLNTGIDFVEVFGRELKWNKIGDAIAETVNGLAKDFDAGKLASAVNYWSLGITEAVIHAVDGVRWDRVGKKIGEFLRKVNISKLVTQLGKVFVKVLEAASTVFVSAFAEAPLETGLLAAIALIKPTTIGGALSGVFKKSFGFIDTKTLTGVLNGILSKLPIPPLQLTIGVGAGLAEFGMVRDTIKDMYDGTQSVIGGIEKIGTTSVITGTIMTGIFGFPAGTIAAGILGLTGALTGYVESVVAANDKIEKLWIADAIKVEGGASLDEYFGNASKLMEDFGQKYGDLLDTIQSRDIEGAKKQIDADMDDICRSIEKINVAVDKSADNLAPQLDNIVKMFENFKKDIENVFSEEIDTVLDAELAGVAERGAEAAAIGQGLQMQTIEEVDRLQKKIQEIQEFIEVGDVTYDEVAGELLDIQKQIRELQTGRVDTIEDRVEEIKLTADFSTLIDPNTQEKALEEMKASMEEYYNTYQGVKSDIEAVNDSYLSILTDWGEQAEKLGDKEAVTGLASIISDQLEDETEQLDKAYTMYISNFQSIESQAWSNIDTIIKQGFEDNLSNDEIVNRVYDYVNDVFVPLEDAIGEQAERVGLEWNTDVSGMVSDMMKTLEKELLNAPNQAKDYDLSGALSGITADFGKQLNGLQMPLKDLQRQETDAAEAARKFADAHAMAGGKASNALHSIVSPMSKLRGNANQVRDAVLDYQKSVEGIEYSTSKAKDGTEKLSGVFGSMKDKLSTKALDNVKKSTDDVVTGFDSATNASKNAVELLKGNLGAIGTLFDSTFANMGTESDTLINQISSGFSNLFAISNWNSMLTGIPNAFKSVWEEAIKAMRNMWNEFSQWVNQNAVIEIPKTKIGNMEIGGGHIKMRIPKYETGGFPEDGLFFANHTEMVGSFRNGQTAVANNTQIVEGIKQGVYEAMMSAMSVNPNGNVTVELQGDAASFFTAMVRENNSSIKRTGTSPLRV